MNIGSARRRDSQAVVRSPAIVKCVSILSNVIIFLSATLGKVRVTECPPSGFPDYRACRHPAAITAVYRAAIFTQHGTQ